ncbi:MAG: SLBB domain-containing protein [Acidobacteriota bacterium]|nr:SLBB domain-containing protein [Acidobacteriota bacterium]
MKQITSPERTRRSVGHGSFLGVTLFLTLANATSTRAQTPAVPQSTREDSSTSNLRRSPRASDLAFDNYAHLAASAPDIREILLKDTGLIVELKRLSIQEATDNGQIVDDASLTDDAIFNRLERDVKFRSLATRLVQRYGYLLPAFNPDSVLGKQQEALLKERAHRQVQIEAQEDAEIDAEGRRQAALLLADRCVNGEDCAEPAPKKPKRPAPQPSQGQPMDQGIPSMQQQLPYDPTDQLLQTRGNSSDFSIGGSSGSSSGSKQLSSLRSDSDGVSSTSASSNDSGDDQRSRISQMMSSSRGGSGLGSGDFGLSLAVDPSSLGSMSLPDNGTNSTSKNIDRARVAREARRNAQTDLSPVSMVHRPNPYADIPSLYDMYVQASAKQRPLERFGLEVFRNEDSDLGDFPIDLPAGPDYVVGPGDGLAIDLWGGVSQRIMRVVDRQGRISLPESGPLLVSGHSLADVQETVQKVLRANYRNVSADVSLARLRTVRVYVVGDVADPGAYDISSLSTPLNALFRAGGISDRGSLRNIKHFRGNKLVEDVDAYDLLLRGVRSQMANLESGDTLLVAPMGPQVTIEGMVRRPAIYELRSEKTLADVLDLAGGILPAAALQHIELQRLVAHEKRTMLTLEISANSDTEAITRQLNAFKIQDGDQIHIFPITPYNESAIYLQGHVLRPGRYSYSDGMKITDLVKSYSDLLPEPAGHYAEIIRLNPPDFRPTVESFDLSAALENPATAPKLEAHDTVRIFGRYDFEPAPEVWIGGEVRSAGKYATSGQVRLRDAIYLAGGITPNASLDSAQLFRTQADGTLKIFSVNLGSALAGKPGDNILLEPRDRLLVHRNTAQVDPATVDIKGEVAKPGRYPLTTNMHIEDLIQVAGGLKRTADPVKANLTRYAAGTPDHVRSENVTVALAAVSAGDTTENKLLLDGDVLTIPQNPGWSDVGASVTVRGEVAHPGPFGIKPGEKLSSVLERAGGFSTQAYPYGAVLMRSEVRELQMSERVQMVRRLKEEEIHLRALPETDTDQKNAKLTALSQTETTLQQLQVNPPIGRVVVRIQPDVNHWKNTAADVAMRDGDILIIPKKASYVTINGQVFNPTALSYRPGRSARWYLGQAGGMTQLANKKAVFVIRADGSVLVAKNNSGFWAGDPLSATLRPGDSIVVPEVAPRIGTRNWQNLFQAGQLAASAALAVAYIHP